MSARLLTEKFIQAAHCPDGRRKIDYFDDRQQGFHVEIRANGGKTYYQRYTDRRGNERQIKIGPVGIISLKQARGRGRQILSEALFGVDPHEAKQALRRVPTFTQFVLDSYLPHVKGYKRSWKTDETMLRLHVLPQLGKLYLDQISPPDVGSLLSFMRSEGYASGTVGRALVIVRFVFNLAKKWKVHGVVENPTSAFRVPPDVERNRYLTRAEGIRLISAIKADQNRVAANAILLLLLTGARRNEITQAQWVFVDWNNKTLLVPLSKTGRPRHIRLNGPSLALLKSIPVSPGNPYIFPSPVTGRPSPHVFFPWDRIRKRAGLGDLRLHDLRHSFASFLINQGKNLYVVQRLLGHVNYRTTQRYAHLTPDTLDEAAESVAVLLNERFS